MPVGGEHLPLLSRSTQNLVFSIRIQYSTSTTLRQGFTPIQINTIYLRRDDDVLFFLSDKKELMIGSYDFSFALNKMD